jgi:AraC-like DNA-binding protein
VAEGCGYVYTARFSTAFKRFAGLTPTAYRNQFRVGTLPRRGSL